MSSPYYVGHLIGLAANLTSLNPLLMPGQRGRETDTGKWKMNLTGAPVLWNSLSYDTAVESIPIGYLDTDGTLAANSDAKVASQKAVKTYVGAAVTGLLDFKGLVDCSANPNYPAASKGDAYIVSVAGKIGGASGTAVDLGDWYVAIADNAGGTEASVGASWGHIEHNLGLVIGTTVQAWDADLDTWATKTPPAGAVVGTTDAQTVTNKRRQPRVFSTASTSTLTPEIDTYDCFDITALAANLTIANHSTSTPANFEKIEIRILDNGGLPRTLTFGTNYVAKGGLSLPTTTTSGKLMTIGFEWVAATSKWNLIALAQE